MADITPEEEKRLKELLNQVNDMVTEVAKQNRKPDQKYIVQVDDNFNFSDDDERYTLGEYDTEEEAVQAAKDLIDKCLQKGHEPGCTAEYLFNGYTHYGEEPFIFGVKFSAWDYARQRCEEMCSAG